MIPELFKQFHWLLLPGTLCTDAVFDGLLDELSVPQNQRHSLVLDKPGIEDYADQLSGLGEETIVCGFSLGAIVAAHHANKLAARRLILFGVNPLADDPSKAKMRKNLQQMVHSTGGSTAMENLLPQDMATTVRSCILSMAEQSGEHIAAHTNLALMRPGAIEILAQAKLPVMVLTGSQDTAATPLQGKAASNAAVNGIFRELANLGHYALLEDPKACANALLKMEQELHDRT